MQINYLGHSCFRIKSGNSVLLTDPFDPKYVGLTMPKTLADIVAISHDHRDHNDLTRLKEPAFTITGPGEYEIKGISVVGLPSFHDKDKTIANIIYIIEAEDVRICHLGDLGHLLDDKQLDQIDGIDVLLTGIGCLDNNQLSINESIKLINQIEPSIIIPMHYRTPEMIDPHWSVYPSLDNFIEEYGSAGEKMDKLVVSRASLPEETQLIVLEK